MIQITIVLLIALLASRGSIIPDLKETPANQLLGLGVITLALGIAYWLLREP